jgi:methylated-DNA-protein-cysteine methyltransferase-like protein
LGIIESTSSFVRRNDVHAGGNDLHFSLTIAMLTAMRQPCGKNFYHAVIRFIKRIPRGRVATYGQIAALAGNPRAARQVAWVLHSASEAHQLPWHRVVNRSGGISLPRQGGYELQRALLIRERVPFNDQERIDLKKFQWQPVRAHFKAGKI